MRRCPLCRSRLKVTASWRVKGGRETRRARRCLRCGYRVRTVEQLAPERPR